MKILITGFKPFNNEKINPSAQLLSELDINFNNYEINTLLLDVLYQKDSERLLAKIKELKPDYVLMLGQAGGRNCISLEYCALNIRNASIPDNHGKLITHEKIKENGPLAYNTNIDIENLLQLDPNIKISYNCGTFICNDIYYNTLDLIYSNNLSIKCLFIHIPYIYEQVLDKNPNTPFMKLNEIKHIIYKLIDKLK